MADFRDLNPSELEFRIVMTLAPLYENLKDDDYVKTRYYDGIWFEQAKEWVADEPDNAFVGTRFDRRGRALAEFSYIFSNKAQRDRYFASDRYGEIKEALANVFDIVDDYTLNGISGHKDIGRA